MTILDKIREVNSRQGLANFNNGMQFEFRILRKAKRTSDLAIRSAGSHSLIDIVRINKGKIYLINCKKNGVWTSKETEALYKLKKKMPSNCIIQKAYYISPKKWVVKNI